MPALTSTTLNGSARGPFGALCPCPLPRPSAPAATLSAPPLPASACPLLSPPSPFATTAPSPLCRPVAGGLSLLTVSGIPGDEGDNTSADVTEDAGEGGRGAAPACMRATSALTAGGWLGCGSGLWDIALHMGSRLSPAPCRHFSPHPRPLPPLFECPTCVELWVHLRLLFHIFSPAIRGLCLVAIGLVLVCTVVVLVSASLSPRHITPFRSPLACFLLRPTTLCAQSRMLQSMQRAPLLPLSLRSPYRLPPARSNRTPVLPSYLPDSPSSACHQAVPLLFSLSVLHSYLSP